MCNYTLIAQTFTGSFDLIAEQNYPNGTIRTDTVSYYFKNKKTAIIIHSLDTDSDLRMIFKPSDSSITSLYKIKEKKGGFILPMNEKYWPGMPEAFRDYGTGPRKELHYTGKAKKIEGYDCREVLAENELYKAEIWLAEDISLSMLRVLSYQSVGKGKSRKEIELFDKFGVEGLPLRVILKSKNKKADVKLLLKNLTNNVEDSIFSTEGYSLTRVK